MSPNRIYFVKRDGLRWSVWWRWIDERVDPVNGRSEWPAAPGLRYWSFRRAGIAAEELWRAYWQGVTSEADARLVQSTRGPHFGGIARASLSLRGEGPANDGLERISVAANRFG